MPVPHRVSRKSTPFQYRQLNVETLENRCLLALVPAMVKDINAGSVDAYPTEFTDVNGTLFFVAHNSAHGLELWKSDGTEMGTTLVKDINPGTASSSPTHLTNVNGTLFFIASDSIHGQDVWKSDGTEAGTVLVKDIAPSPFGHSTQDFILLNVNGTLYFNQKEPSTSSNPDKYGLWKTDGTEAGTVLLKYANIEYDFFVFNDNLFFMLEDQDNVNSNGLWSTDGTVAGTKPVITKPVFGHREFNPPHPINVSGTIFFQGTDPQHGFELWKSDGTEAGTVLVKEINPGMASSLPDDFTNVNGTLFFTAFNRTYGRELWKSDGTTAGTVRVKDIWPGGLDIAPYGLLNGNGTLYFIANDRVHGEELWKSDGTEAGTTMIKDSYPGNGRGASNGNGAELQMINGILYYPGDDGSHGTELWQSNGTAAKTFQVKDIYPGSFGCFPKSVTNVNGTIYFFARDAVHGFELWKLDSSDSMKAEFSGGNLTISDNSGIYRNDTLNLNLVGGNLVVTGGQFKSAPAGTTLNASRTTLTVPFASITGKLTINMGLGDDSVYLNTVFKTNAPTAPPIPSQGIQVNLGEGIDRLTFGFDVTNNNWIFDGAQSGRVDVGSLGTITFDGLEYAKGNNGVDNFDFSYSGTIGVLGVRGNGGFNTIEMTRDADFTLSDDKLTWSRGSNTQSLVANDFLRAILTGGPGNNFMDARRFIFGSVQLNGGDGDDVLWGTSRNDILNGGNGNDWLSGGYGNDILLGYAGRDILVGGSGRDQFNLSNEASTSLGDDVLIGGRTYFEFNKNAIDALLASWASSISYAAHITALQLTGVGPTTQYRLNSNTISDDNADEILFGGSGLDWFFAGTSGTNKDTHDRAGNEQVVEV